MKKTLLLLGVLGMSSFMVSAATLTWDNSVTSADMSTWMSSDCWGGTGAPSNSWNGNDNLTFNGANANINFVAMPGVADGAQGEFYATTLTFTGNSNVSINNIKKIQGVSLTIDKGSSLTFGSLGSSNLGPDMHWNIYGSLTYQSWPNFSGGSLYYNLSDSGTINYNLAIGSTAAKFKASVYSGHGHNAHTLVNGYNIGNFDSFTIEGGTLFTGTKADFLALEANEENAGKYFLEKTGTTVTLYSIGTMNIPEPTSASLGLLGLGTLLLRRRRQA